MRNTRTSRTPTDAAQVHEAPSPRDLLRRRRVWGWCWRKLVLVDYAVEQRIRRWGVGR